ncbi:MAG: hypothetical protein WCK63_14835 [Betaproteobacteria bacterium]
MATINIIQTELAEKQNKLKKFNIEVLKKDFDIADNNYRSVFF